MSDPAERAAAVQHLAAARKERIPSGAPPRKPADLSAFTSQQKIAPGPQRGGG